MTLELWLRLLNASNSTQKIGIKRVDKGPITKVKGLQKWRFMRSI